jgi:FKBP-type peptidyl-prolyl cis-trans isomerase FkpA
MKMFKSAVVLSLLLFITPAYAAGPPLTEDQKIVYAIGASVARSLAVFNFTPAEVELVQQGLSDTLAGKKMDGDMLSYNSRIQDLAKSRRKAAGEKQVGAGKDFLEKAAGEKGAVKTDSGMVYTSLVEGNGNSPTATDVVKVHYRGTLADGTEFDSSYKRGKALEFRLNNVISCWVEGVQKMKPGGKAKLVCPPKLAYGDNGSGELILPGATLAFEVELIEVLPSMPTPVVAAPIKPAEPAKK